MKKKISILVLFLIFSGLYSPSFSQEVSESENVQKAYSYIKYHETRIVGGNPVTDISKYPWIAALVHSYQEKIYDGQFCGGTLVAPDWVVTAAHCVCESLLDVKEPDEIDVVLGMLDLKAEPETYERIKVSKIIVHPNYNADLTDNDVALLKLQTPSSQQEIGYLATKDSDKAQSTPNGTVVMGTIIGWGDTEQQTRSYPAQLQEVTLPLVSNEECSNFFEDGQITRNMLCAGFVEGEKDACFGDSGGPLVTTRSDGAYTLVGIVSWGNGCAQPDTYGVYTRVSRIQQWVLQMTGSPVILTDSAPATIFSGNDTVVYGWQGINNLIIKSGAHAKLINFPGINLITIEVPSSQFSVYRAGATVTLQDEVGGTMVVMPATASAQLIVFDDITTTLEIERDKAIMLGNQAVTTIKNMVNITE